VTSHRPAIAHARIEERAGQFKLAELYPPILIPDAESFTQLELPKIMYDDIRQQYCLIISTCNRLFEGQSDAEVDKKIRMYESRSIEGPWIAYRGDSELTLSDPHLFGLSVLNADFANRALHCISPYTEAAQADKALSISSMFTIPLK
jgi:hypothetical protein